MFREGQKIDDQIDIAERRVEVAAERRTENVEATYIELAAERGDGFLFRFDDGVHGSRASRPAMVAVSGRKLCRLIFHVS